MIQYHKLLKKAEDDKLIARPKVPESLKHNAHIYYAILNNKKSRDLCITFMKARGIIASFHYIPLHSSPAGKKYATSIGNMKNTNSISERIIRLPLFYKLKEKEQSFIISTFLEFLYKKII